MISFRFLSSFVCVTILIKRKNDKNDKNDQKKKKKRSLLFFLPFTSAPFSSQSRKPSPCRLSRSGAPRREKSCFCFRFFRNRFFFPFLQSKCGSLEKEKKGSCFLPALSSSFALAQKKKKNGKRKPKNTKNSTHVSTHPFGLAHDRGIENLSGGTQISAASNSTSTLVSLPAALSTLPRTSR